MMPILERLLQRLGFSKIIKIPGKSSFDQLSIREVGSLIDSFLYDGNDEFDASALSEFLGAQLRNEQLKRVQSILRENAFMETDSSEWPRVNERFLRDFAGELKAGNVEQPEQRGHP